MKLDKLLPCPFCGNKVRIIYKNKSPNYKYKGREYVNFDMEVKCIYSCFERVVSTFKEIKDESEDNVFYNNLIRLINRRTK